VRSIDALAAGTAEPIAQDDARATFSRRIGPEDRWIDWTAPAGTVANLVRALSPTPSAVTTFRGAALRVFRVRVVDRVGSPGQIVGVAPDGFEVAAGEGALRLLDVAPAGRRRMSGAAFASGARPIVGERLG
jgi:methionyl-tRNA formyltransferase